MIKFRNKLVIGFSVLMLLCTVSLTTIAANPVKEELIIVHTNDMHGQIDPGVKELAYLKAYKEHVSADALFDAGDASQGLPVNNVTKGRAMGELMEAIGFNAMAVGNHEFDFSLDSVLGKEDGFFTASPSIKKLGTNVYYSPDSKTGVPNDPVFETSITMDLDGVKVSVYGLSTPETKVKADPRHSEGIDFRDPIPALKEEVKKDMHKDSEYHIVIGHLGTDLETKEAWRMTTVAEALQKDPDFNQEKYIVIDGHSHTAYLEGLRFGDNVIYGQTGGTLGSLGEIRINLKEFEKSTSKNVMIRDGYEIDAEMAKLTPDQIISDKIDVIYAEYDDLTQEVVISDNPIEFEGDRSLVRTRETNLGNIIADSIYNYGLDTFEEFSHVAVMNGGGIRASLPKGKLTLKEIITVMPYGNRIVQIDVTGAQLLAMYEHALKAPTSEELDDNGVPLLTSDPAILHSSDSIRVKFDPRLEAGSRVQDIQIIDEETNTLVPLDLNKTYKVVTLEFLAVGGDGFTMLGGPRNEGITDSDIFADTFRSHGKGEDIDWTLYSEGLEPYRIVPTKFAPLDAASQLITIVDEATTVLDNRDKYTEESLAVLDLAIANVNDIISKFKTRTYASLTNVTEEDFQVALTELRTAIDGLEEVVEIEEPKVPVDPTPPVEEKPTVKPPVNEKPAVKPPATGIKSDFTPIIIGVSVAVIALAAYVLLGKKGKEKE